MIDMTDRETALLLMLLGLSTLPQGVEAELGDRAVQYASQDCWLVDGEPVSLLAAARQLLGDDMREAA